MKSVLFFAVVAALLISTHASRWDDIQKRLHDGVEKAKHAMNGIHIPALPVRMQQLIHQAQEKLEQHKFRKDMHHALKSTHRDLLKKWKNIVASAGLKVRDHEAMERLMHHMMLSQARHNMEQSATMHNAAHQLITKFLAQKRSAHDIHALSTTFGALAHTYMRKYVEGAEVILHKHGVNMDKAKLAHILQRSCLEAITYGKSAVDTLMAAMKKCGANTDDFDSEVKNELKAHFDKLKTAGKAELMKLLRIHNVPLRVEEVLAAMPTKAKEMMAKMKALDIPRDIQRLENMARMAFRNLKPGDHKRVLMHLHIMIRPALIKHFQRVREIFMKHKMNTNHAVVHYTIYHGMRDAYEHHEHHDYHHHSRWWHHKAFKYMLYIGGPIFCIAIVVALIITVVHMLREKRRTPPRKTEIYGCEKSSLPYAIMDEKSEKGTISKA